MTLKPRLLGGVELGGTKCVCVIGTGPDDVRMRHQIPTGTSPNTTLRCIAEALQEGIAQYGPLAALGIASFGPIDLSRNSGTYGHIRKTAKPRWSNVPVAPPLAREFGVPTGFDTDVNAAALAEGRWGAARGLKDFAYVTIGTGVGVGLVVGGLPATGFNHSELGHIRIARRPGDSFAGACVFHGDCVEGLASGHAIAARAGGSAADLGSDDPAWEFVAHAIAQLLHTMVLSTAPRRILIGGGVTEARPELLPRIRELLVESLNGYIDLAQLGYGLEDYVTAPGLGSMAGPLGALALAANAL
jgi:fructokinase